MTQLDILDIPDWKLDLIIRFVIQGRGKLPAAERGSFPEISDEERAALESVVEHLFDSARQAG